MPGFLNENTLAKKELTEGSFIDMKEVPKDRLALMKSLKLDPDYASQTISGYVITSRTGQKRFHSDAIKKMARSKIFRWIEVHQDNQVSVGC